MRPQWSDEKFREAHEKDSWTTWFGVSFEENGEKLLRNCDCFEQLMFEWEPPKRADLCPSIVSFVGETGAGKSSIIALLIKILEQDTVLEVPVVGLSKHGQRPTSGDVHLYLDPVSITGSHPILYADCEGMNGGNREPTSRSVFSRNGKENLPTKAIRYMKKLVWGPEVMSQADREFIVLNLYSRILYTFSDVVVFVLTNTSQETPLPVLILLSMALTSLVERLNPLS
ncbi:hypothetical protein QBC37DRAFT_122870 [Rhypophila decipiens]|uniref:Uncharacterized protein n=1 Tax=Rhypophila decipiens TaxID=261697 RepID=A0AAN7B7C6_9PEZI|nr:hypothetical protein QBC37DRAFT_122870 [Rhypophila decipiens]